MQETPEAGYEVGSLMDLNFKTAAFEIAERGIKLIHNGGALNPEGLYTATKSFLIEKGLSRVKVAWVEGDDVTQEILTLEPKYRVMFPHLDIEGEDLRSVKTKILSANAYIGMRGILAALNAGAQIIICGQICDAAPVMALSAWYAISC